MAFECVRTSPYNLKTGPKDNTLCACCGSKLLLEIKQMRILIGDECYSCRYQDRPFALGSVSAGPCTCKYKEVKGLLVTCKKCISPRCIKCNRELGFFGKCKEPCSECTKKEEFKKQWENSSLSEKLKLYGVKKLRILAKRKKIKRIYTYKKQQLIEILSPLVVAGDLPIKDNK